MPEPNKKTVSSLLVLLAFAIVYIVWGSTYFFIIVALKGFPPMMLGALRFLMAGAIMLAWCAAKGEKLFVANDIKNAAVSGMLMLFVGTGVVIWVEQYLPSALVAILVSAAPMWFVMMDKRAWKENFSNKSTVAGLVFGFMGVILLFKEKVTDAFSGGNNYTEIGCMFLLMLGSLCWTSGSLHSKYHPSSGSNTVNVAWQIMIPAIPFALLSFILHEPEHLVWSNVPAVAWFSLFYLVLFGSIAAYTAYVWLLQVRPSAQVSTYAYVNPVVAVLLGVFLGAEHISVLQLTGLFVILASVLLINLAKYRK